MPFSSSCCASCVGHFLVYSSIKSTFVALSRRWPPKMCPISTDCTPASSVFRLLELRLLRNDDSLTSVSTYFVLARIVVQSWPPNVPGQVVLWSFETSSSGIYVSCPPWHLAVSKGTVAMTNREQNSCSFAQRIFWVRGHTETVRPSLPLLGEATTVLLMVGWSLPPHAIAEKCWDIG